MAKATIDYDRMETLALVRRLTNALAELRMFEYGGKPLRTRAVIWDDVDKCRRAVHLRALQGQFSFSDK